MSESVTKQLRADTALILFEVLEQGVSLRESSPKYLVHYQTKDKALMNELILGVLRYLPKLQFWLNQLLAKPLKDDQQIIQKLLLVGLYQLAYTRVPSHAAVGETVEACAKLKFQGLKGLVNGVLRNAIRKDIFSVQPKDQQLNACLPKWLYRAISRAYPNQQEMIFTSLLEKAPIWLRVNQQQISLQDYTQKLPKDSYISSPLHPQGLVLTQAGDIRSLPGFEEGEFAVQDGAAQMAAVLLDAQPNDNVLDACAAPGGKTCHIIERTPSLNKIIALDSDAKRLERVSENLSRLHLSAQVVVGDASETQSWWDGEKFDRILLDAPCSALGVLRRHPDIKWHRRASDIQELVTIQQNLLQALWGLLKENGVLLYATCSILPEENQQQIHQFLEKNTDAKLIPISHAKEGETGWQILPGEYDMDGFYYAKLQKCT